MLARFGSRDPEMGYLEVCQVEVLTNRHADKTRCLSFWKLAIQEELSDLGCQLKVQVDTDNYVRSTVTARITPFLRKERCGCDAKS
jgi:hypothetical protein